MTEANGHQPHLPPGSRAPAVAQTVELVRDPFAFFERRRARFGPIFRARILGYPRLVYVGEPELARAVFATDRTVGRAGEVRREVMEPLVGPASLLCLEGDEWLRHRKLVGPPLHGRVVEGYRERIAAIAAAEIDRWPLAEPFALRPRAAAITLEVILQIVFGVRDAAQLERLRALLPALIDAGTAAATLGFLGGLGERVFESRLARHLPRNPIRRFWALREETDATIADEIAGRRAAPDPEAEDVLSLLVAARDGDGRGLSDGEIRDELVTLLEAGHETTATALAWTFERLVRHPAALERLRDEVDRGRGEYLDAVVKESLRTRPVVVDAPRILAGPLELGGYSLPTGWYVAPAFPLVHSDPRRYPEPDRFRPERFLDGAIPPDAWIPFGGGKRRCVGSHLAMLELRTVVAEVVRRLDLRPASPAPERVRVHHVTMVPAGGARVIARRRTAEAPPARRRSGAPRARTAGGRTRAPTAQPPARAPGA
jgi:cytochrome P450 family 135